MTSPSFTVCLLQPFDRTYEGLKLDLAKARLEADGSF